MAPDRPTSFTAFEGARRIAAGPLDQVVLAARRALQREDATVLIYDDATGRVVDVDMRGEDRDVLGRLPRPMPEEEPAPRGRGRPKLGVVAREITLLPRHWEWLRAQPGGASVALRKLVEEARRTGAGRDLVRARREASYCFLSAMAGDLPGYEDALRALFAGDRPRFEGLAADWPQDVRDYGLALADGSWLGRDEA